MVPEENRIIAEKVIAAESQVVAWGRDRVWANLNNEPSPVKSTVVYYAAAVFVLLVLSGGIYSVRQSQQEKLNDRITSLEHLIKNRATIKTALRSEKICTEATIASIGYASKRSIKSVLPFQQPSLRVEIPVEAVETRMIRQDSSGTSISVTHLETIVAPEKKSLPNVVQAVIGYIPITVERPAVADRKKMRSSRFRFFPSNKQEALAPSPESGQSFTARIN